MRHSNLLLLLAVAILAAAGPDAFSEPATSAGTAKRKQDTFSGRIEKDITYRTVDGMDLKLDLYRPKAATAPLPVIVWVHGGGWKQGSKDRCQAKWLCDHGFAVASIQYRLTHQARWPAQLDDCRAAVRWLRANAKAWELNPDRIGAWGSSAGGHLVALMGTADTPADEKTSSAVMAVCDWYGPSDLLTMPPNVVGNGRTEADVAKSNGAKLLGQPIPAVPELAKQASAFHQASKGDARFLIMHGSKDPGVPLIQSQKLHQRLTEVGVPSTLHIIEGAGHGGKQFQTDAARQVVLGFFQKALSR